MPMQGCIGFCEGPMSGIVKIRFMVQAQHACVLLFSRTACSDSKIRPSYDDHSNRPSFAISSSVNPTGIHSMQ